MAVDRGAFVGAGTAVGLGATNWTIEVGVGSGWVSELPHDAIANAITLKKLATHTLRPIAEV